MPFTASLAAPACLTSEGRGLGSVGEGLGRTCWPHLSQEASPSGVTQGCLVIRRLGLTLGGSEVSFSIKMLPHKLAPPLYAETN